MVSCPCCGGDSTFLGALGSRNHFRCRDCGADFSATESQLRLTGMQAIEAAEAMGLKLNKYADPTEDAREGLTVDEAREIARVDASLIYVDVDDRRAVESINYDSRTITG